MTRVPSRRRTSGVLRGIGSLVVLAAGLLGVPLLLWHIGSPITDTDWSSLGRRLLLPDDGTLLRLVLTFGAWAAWAVFTLSVATEALRLASGRRIRVRWPLMAPSQHLAATLLLAVLALASASRASADVAVQAPSVSVVQSATDLTSDQLEGEGRGEAENPDSAGPREVVPSGHVRPAAESDPDPGTSSSVALAVSIALTNAPQGRPAHVHVVAPGDDLWSLAERYYGSGAAWRTIASANPDRLSGGPDRLLPGWRLVIPGGDASGEDGPGDFVTVRRGDTLAHLAAENLGSAERWRELYRVNRALISDPDRLLVGLRLRLPEAPPSSQAPAEGTPSPGARAEETPRRPAETGPRAGAQEPGAEARSRSTNEKRQAVPRQAESESASGGARDRVTIGQGSPTVPIIAPSDPPRAVPSAAASEGELRDAGHRILPAAPSGTSAPQHESVPTRSGSGPDDLGGNDRAGDARAIDGPEAAVSVLGVSAALASALLGGLALRRRRQLAMRPVGRRLLQPTVPAQRLEVQLGQRQASVAHQAVDVALRAVAAHCQRTREPLPALRRVSFDDASIELFLAAPAGAPPAGFTSDGPRWSVDVSAVSSWSDQFDPGVGPRPYPALVSLGTEAGGRTVMVDLEECRVVDVRLGADDTEGFLAAVTAELSFAPWADELLVTVVGSDHGWCVALDQPSVQREDDLDAVLDRLHTRAEAQRQHRPPGPRGHHRMTVDLAAAWTPEILIVTDPPTPDQAQRLVGLLTAEPPVTAAAVVAGPVSGAPLRLSGTAERAVIHPIGHQLRAQVLEPAAAVRVRDLVLTTGSAETRPAPWWADASSPPPGTQQSWGTSINESEGSTNVHDQAGGAAGPHHPVLRMLGPVDLLGAAGTPPTRASKQCLEYAAWLLEHPGTTAMAMAAALSIAEGTRRSNMSRLRGWLGTGPDGKAYLPDAYSGHIVLHPAVSSDWQRLQILTVGGVNKTSSEGLRAALELVRGAPLADAAPGQWHWAEELRTDMISAVRDIGVELAERALAAGQLDLARWAAARALTAAPADERLMTLRIRTEHRAGNAAETERLTLQLAAQARAIGIDLDPTTVTTLQEVLEGRVRARVPV
jgi:nucleoid-associated protein YgaU